MADFTSMHSADDSLSEGAAAVRMDLIYGRQRHIYDATRKYYLLGRDRLIRELAPPAGGSVIEIGCGTGRNLIAAARAYPNATLFGLDISSAMLSTARANLRHAGLEGRITLARGDATRFDAEGLFGRSSFDRAFFSYGLSMIPDWREALVQALQLAAPAGGRLLLVDFGQQERLPAWFRHLLFTWLSRFHVRPCAELEAVLSALARAQNGRLDFRSLYRGYAWLAAIAR
jgi:S-adenosylmethionine-diacylgycerolhomoserine-N-methlytransferase